MTTESHSSQAHSGARTRVKICGFTREQDIDAAVAAGVDAVGFVLYPPSPRHVPIERAAALARRLPPFITPVLLFVNAAQSMVAAACHLIPHATLQFHGDESPADCAIVADGRHPYLRAARIPLDADAVPFDLVKFSSDFSTAQAILLDAHVEGYGGGGKTFNWSLLPANVNSHLVLGGGLTPANVTDGIRQVRTRLHPGRTLSVDVSSGVEIAKGIKDPAKMQAFMAAVRAADQ
jgi:phosphoribosylanthranilate isomerase